ncbi:glycoside hydrolase family 130 protein [Clostridium lacusfryxellense]|uniref:glycoside hydrolase family 130 protein n=1 Tax=Clostridium lacusfryxellense TaxID=205328 RepID=UPI001FE779D9
MLCRVAESVKVYKEDEVKIPIVVNVDGKDIIDIVSFNKKIDTEYDYSDSRSLGIIENGGARKIAYLTSLSHIRIARSKDGENFKIEDEAFIKPIASEEEWGIEDPRITQIEDTYYINYTSVTRNGAATSLVSTNIAFNRPVPYAIGGADMWIAESPDLEHWRKQKHFYGVSNEESWENGRVVGGAVPFYC